MFNKNNLPSNPYVLLTAGPLSTTKSVKAAMLKDWCVWDEDYYNIVQQIRDTLLKLSVMNYKDYSTVLMQGSGTYLLEAVVGSMMPNSGKLLILSNGGHGKRLIQIADALKIKYISIEMEEGKELDLRVFQRLLIEDKSISHVAAVHCEITTGILNPIHKVSQISKKYNKILLLDGISTFGGIPIDIDGLDIDFLVGSSDKCLQGIPGVGFVIAKRESITKCKGQAKSLSFDLYDQWIIMEKFKGKWRFSSPTHVVHAFYQALIDIKKEGGILKRYRRYCSNQEILVHGMRELGFTTLLSKELHSPIITAFNYPDENEFDFYKFYDALKMSGFIIYPGKLENANTFRIGNIGDIDETQINKLLRAIKINMFWK